MTPRILRATLLIAAAALLPLSAGCAATLKSGSHVERNAQFTHYRTWEWAAAEQEQTGDPRLDSNPMFEESLRTAVERQLARKGYVRSIFAGPPDLRVQYHVNFSRTFEVTGGPSGIGTCSGDCEPEAYAYEQGTLVVDLIDARSGTVAWRAWSRDDMEGIIDDQDAMDREIVSLVAAMFEQLPSAP